MLQVQADREELDANQAEVIRAPSGSVVDNYALRRGWRTRYTSDLKNGALSESKAIEPNGRRLTIPLVCNWVSATPHCKQIALRSDSPVGAK